MLCHLSILIPAEPAIRTLRFGFHLTFSSGLAWTVLIVEVAGVVMLLTAALIWRRR